MQVRRTRLPLFQLFPLIQCNGPCDLSDAEALVRRLLIFLGAFAGVVAVLVILWAAYQFITSAGNPEKASAARKTLFAGLIGLIIVLSAYAFVSVFARTIFGGPVPIPPNLTPP